MLAIAADESSGGTDDDADDRDPGDEPELVASAPSPSSAPRGVPRDPVHTVMCEGYCKELAEDCARPGFASEAECRATCNDWPLGTPGVLGPTVACHVEVLPGNATGFGSCIAAGPSSPICVDHTPSCAKLCDDLLGACGPTAGLADVGECREWCGELPVGKLGEELDTVACHQHHAELALGNRRYCDAAGPESSVCTDG